MKIGILTLPLCSNYGGILQCYALQTVLQQMGHQVVVLNRTSAFSFITVFLRIGSVMKCLIRRFIFGKKNIRIANPFSVSYGVNYPVYDVSELQSFIHARINRTFPIVTSGKLRSEVQHLHLDALIVGSDQVWRECYSPCITDYFLGFKPDVASMRKIAYAASFGTNDAYISEKYLEKCVSLAHQFQFISVRESFGIDILKNIFGLTATQVLDPTMLLEVDSYLSLMKSKDAEMFQSKTLTYVLDWDTEKKEIINYIVHELHQPRMDFMPITGGTEKLLMLPSVSRWLSAFKYASFIITDSFHGCVFSILFKKNFVAILNKERGADRFFSLLSSFGLQERLIESIDELEKKKLWLVPINYTQLNEKYERMRINSIAFLWSALSN